MNFTHYDPGVYFDELFSETGKPREFARPLIERINTLPEKEVERRQRAADQAFYQMGITFTVYGNEEGTEKIFPFDIIPRMVSHPEWLILEKGLKQRILALNLLLQDLYGDQKILKDKILPEELIRSGSAYRPECQGLQPPQGIWIHITGTDLVRGADGTFYVLEDNLRCPSGVSYVLENREVLKRTWPRLFQSMRVKPLDEYPNKLLGVLDYVSSFGTDQTQAVVLTPGIYNSAYFEHSFLAREMGIPLVEGRDLVVEDDRVYMRTTRGFERVDVIYRRVDDDFLDPRVFRKDSMLGLSGLMECYRKGNVALANAPGTGIADDKAVYGYVPEIIRYYLSEDPILANVPTYICWRPKDLQYVLENLDKMVVKAVDASGGYGMLIGHQASKKEIETFREKLKAHPRAYIAQPVVNLSRVPVIVDGKFEGRHVDFRPYILYGKEIFVLPGGLTRVALKRDSLVVNSSQGGGSKDTWVLEC